MKTLESFDFGASRASFGKKTYNWDAILNGEIHVLEAGKDFQCKAQTLRMMARKAAEKLELGVRSAKTKEGNIVIQAYKLTDEDKKFAKARSEAAAKKKAEKKEERTDEERVNDDIADEDDDLNDVEDVVDEEEEEEEEEVKAPAKTTRRRR